MDYHDLPSRRRTVACQRSSVSLFVLIVSFSLTYSYQALPGTTNKRQHQHPSSIPYPLARGATQKAAVRGRIGDGARRGRGVQNDRGLFRFVFFPYLNALCLRLLSFSYLLSFSPLSFHFFFCVFRLFTFAPPRSVLTFTVA